MAKYSDINIIESLINISANPDINLLKSLINICALKAKLPSATITYAGIHISGSELYSDTIELLNNFFILHASSLKYVIITESVNKCETPLNSEWLLNAHNLKSINIAKSVNIISAPLVAAIAQNDHITEVMTDGAFSRDLNKEENELLNATIESIVNARSADCVEINYDKPKLGLLGFNSHTQTWLPYDCANKMWKLKDLSYDENSKSFCPPDLIPAPLNVRVSKVNKLKAEGAYKFENLKNELKKREEDRKKLTETRDLCFKIMDNSDDDIDSLEEKVAELTTLIRNHNCQTRVLEAKIFDYPSEIVAKLENQKALDEEFWIAFDASDFTAMELALKKGADIFAKHSFNLTAKELAMGYENHEELVQFLAKMEAQQDALNLAASDKAASASLDSSDPASAFAAVGAGFESAAAGGPLNLDEIVVPPLGDSDD